MQSTIRIQLVVPRRSLERVKHLVCEIQQVLNANHILCRFIHRVLRHLILENDGVGHL